MLGTLFLACGKISPGRSRFAKSLSREVIGLQLYGTPLGSDTGQRQPLWKVRCCTETRQRGSDLALPQNCGLAV